MHGVAGVAVASAVRFGSEDPLAPLHRVHWYHRSITEMAAAAQGWSAGASAEIGRHSFGVDLYAYHPIWCLRGGPARWRAARRVAGDLACLHFDNLATTEEIAESWVRITGGAVVGVEWAARRGDAGVARQVVGAALHAIQDFYSHSTWIDDPTRRDHILTEHAGELPDLSTGGFGAHAGRMPHHHGDTRLTWTAPARLPGLLFGRRAGPSTGPAAEPGADHDGSARPGRGVRYGPVPGINLDSRWQAAVGARTRGLSSPEGSGSLSGDDAFDLVLALAVRESRSWLARLDERFGDRPETAEFWARVRGGPVGEWTAPWNDPGLAAHGFLTAGDPPPGTEGQSGRWFLRLVVSGRGSARRGSARHRSCRLRLYEDGGAAPLTWPVPDGAVRFLGPLPEGLTGMELDHPAGAALAADVFRRAPEPRLHTLAAAVITAGTTSLAWPPSGA